MTRGPGKEPPVDLGEAAEVEDLSTSEAAERLDLDPDAQRNRTDRMEPTESDERADRG